MGLVMVGSRLGQSAFKHGVGEKEWRHGSEVQGLRRLVLACRAATRSGTLARRRLYCVEANGWLVLGGFLSGYRSKIPADVTGKLAGDIDVIAIAMGEYRRKPRFRSMMLEWLQNIADSICKSSWIYT